MVTVNRPQSVELSGIASASAEVELWVARQPSAQVPEPATVVAALPPNRNRPPASGEPDGWSHWLSDSSTASFGQWPKVKVKATTQSETLGTLVDEVEGRVWIKPDESPVYDPRGNLIQDGGWSYEWDARNRLLAAEMKAEHLPDDLPQIRVEHLYDWLSRRVVTITKERRVDTQTGARESVWRVLEHRHFWYDGWHLMAETVQGGATGSVAAVTQRYIWGLDLAGDWERGMGQTRPQGSGTRTGGVGALLGVMTSAGKTYSVCNDANGNVMGFIDLDTATLTARFDYDAFGNQITNWTAPGHPAPETVSRIRFSGKYQDSHTGWLYYGYRWYDAENGRWPSRDPIGERGGLNLYGMVGNDVVNTMDYLGLSTLLIACYRCCETESARVQLLYDHYIRMDIVSKKFSEQAEQSRKMYAASQFQGGVALAEVAAGFGLTLHGLPGADGRPPKGVLKRVKKIPERIEKACKKGARSPLAFGAGLVLSTYGVVDAYLSINEIKDWQALAKKDQTEAVLAEIELAKVKTELQMASDKLRLCLSQLRIFVTP